jgi:SAM-dependent methyltransferase
MLRAARNRAPAAGLLAGDADALPLRDGACDLTLAMHMLYHVPGPLAAVRELRRVTRRDGRVLVALNGRDHLTELRDLVTVALQEAGSPAVPAVAERIDLDQGEDLLGFVFASVARHDFTAELLIPGPAPLTRYVRSMRPIQQLSDPEAVVTAVGSQLPSSAGGVFRVRTHSGCLICS